MTLEIDRRMLNKVPLVTLFFWIIKILATTVGETGADFLIFNLGFGLTLTSLLAALLLAGWILTWHSKACRVLPIISASPNRSFMT